jgi:predicted Zn-dependent protease
MPRENTIVDLLILSRLKQRVEAAIAAILLLSCVPGAAMATTEPSDTNEVGEPDPSPQVELPAHSDYTEAHRLLAQRKWEEAAIVLRSVMKKSPDFSPGAMELARALTYLGRREEALTTLAQAATRQSGARKADIVERVRVLSRMFLTQKTFQAYQDGLNLLVLGKVRPAREKFEKALGTEPDNVEILTRIGECFVLDGDFDSAAERLRLAKRLNPYEPEISLWLGHALHQRGELVDAVTELKFAHDGLRGSERAPIWYAEALLSAGNRKAAVQVLENDAEQQPFHLIGILTLARMRTELFRDGSDSLWNARRDLQVAMSRLPQYGAGEGAHSESDLGVELREPVDELKGQIGALLAQLDNRLKDSTTARGATRTQH